MGQTLFQRAEPHRVEGDFVGVVHAKLRRELRQLCNARRPRRVVVVQRRVTGSVKSFTESLSYKP
jgi:hypothetical protein